MKMEANQLASKERPKPSRRPAILHDLGFVEDYSKVWDYQKRLLQKRIERTIADSVVMVEHAHVITLGRSAHVENILVPDLPIFEIERGGDVTYHGPGQLVVYPIISLQEISLGVKQYVELLEKVIIEALAEFGLACEGKLGEMTGVWVREAKIASIGVATSHWVTYHGFALNVNTDLAYFEKIRPCGFESKIMTSVAHQLGRRRIEMSEVKRAIVSSLSENFDFEIKVVDEQID